MEYTMVEIYSSSFNAILNKLSSIQTLMDFYMGVYVCIFVNINI